jgi:hypothetical protein
VRGTIPAHAGSSKAAAPGRLWGMTDINDPKIGAAIALKATC